MLDDIAVYVNLFDERRRWRLDLDNTDERLMDAAEELFASKGYDGVTVREIIKAADVKNIGAISYYFGGKRELYFAILRRHFRKVHRLAEMINREHDSPVEKLRLIFRAVRETYLRSPNTIKLLLNEINQPSEFFDELELEMINVQNIAQRIIEEGIERGIFRRDLDVRSATLVMMSIAHFAYMVPNLSRRLLDDDYLERSLDCYIKGLGARDFA